MKYLIVVDMQNDFISGSLGTKEAEHIVENVCKKIEQYKAEGYEILATRDTHFGEEDPVEERRYSNTQEGKNLPVVHCIRGSWGWEIEDQVKQALGEVRIFDKYTFGSEELVSYLKNQNPEEIELIGLCTDICVVSNGLLLKAAMPEVPMKVDQNCTAGVTPESHAAALTTMTMCQIAVI
jgi:nicotinamidase-related amidase